MIIAQRRNFMIFLSLRFYVKSILGQCNVEVQNLPFFNFKGSELTGSAKIHKSHYPEPPNVLKRQFLNF